MGDPTVPKVVNGNQQNGDTIKTQDKPAKVGRCAHERFSIDF